MFKVTRAIILAAGFGSRMGILTQDTPKPLIPVHGTPIIEKTIAYLETNGIQEIIIIVGYLKEKFNYLTTKYQNVQLIENPYYDTCNNISSIYVARDYLDVPVMIIEGDQYFTDRAPLDPSFEHAEYNASWSPVPGPEWIVDSDDNLIFGQCYPEGGRIGWLSYGVSRWPKKDAQTLRQYITYEFENGTRDCYWDIIPIFTHRDKFNLYIRPTSMDTHIELDSLEELAAYDSTYLTYLEENKHANER